MEPKFQTSFIPKKQVATIGGTIGGVSTQPRQKTSLSSAYMALAVILFIVSLLGVAGSFAWKYYSAQQNKNYNEQLAMREKQYKIEEIEKLKTTSVQISTADTLLKNHIAFSKIFDQIGKMAISEVRFMNMDLKVNDSGKISVNVKGLGKNLPAVAFQSDVLGDLAKYGVSTIFTNPVIQSPGLESTGAIGFGFTADVDRSALLFKTQENK